MRPALSGRPCFAAMQPRDDVVEHLFSAQTIGVDDVIGAGVMRHTQLVKSSYLGQRWRLAQHRPYLLAPAHAGQNRFGRDPDEDAVGALFQHPPIRGDGQCSTAERDNARLVVFEDSADRIMLVTAKRGFSFVRKNRRHLAVRTHHQSVGVEEGAAKSPGEPAADRRFSGCHEADQGHVALHRWRVKSWPAASRLRRRFSNVSSIESPPYFSSSGSISASRTIASPTIAAAGTTHTSLRT